MEKEQKRRGGKILRHFPQNSWHLPTRNYNTTCLGAEKIDRPVLAKMKRSKNILLPREQYYDNYGTKLTSREPIYICVVPKFELTALSVHFLLSTICNFRAAWGLIVPIDKEDDDMFATFLRDRKTHLGEGRNPSIYLLT